MIKVVAAALGRRTCRALGAVFLGAFLAALFFGERIASAPNLSGSIARQVLAVFHDPGTQWMVCLCLPVYFVAFSFPRIHSGVANHGSILLLAFLLLIEAVRYVWHYAASMQALVLLAGVVIGQGAGALREGGRKKVEGRNGNGWGLVIVYVIVGLLVLASVWRADVIRTFEYRNHLRWTGPWDNPNIFGLLMGTGVMLAIGLAVSSFRCSVYNGSEGSKGKYVGWKYWRQFCGIWCLVAAGFMGRGLWHSYSRGAWVAVGCGLPYLIVKAERRRKKAKTGIATGETGKVKVIMDRMADARHKSSPVAQTSESAVPRVSQPASARITKAASPFERPADLGIGDTAGWETCATKIDAMLPWIASRFWLFKNWFPVAVIFVSVLVLVLWRLGTSRRNVVADRIVSVVNANDFSWRNRVAAWKGTLQIVAEHPWLGAGWNRPERLYANYYLPAKLDESAAIEMNDYLMLGATLGVPALLCFLVYLWLSLTANTKSRKLQAETAEPDWLSIICHTGAIVLAVGFWFDGGLFKLPTASTFWILLELGRGSFHRGDEDKKLKRGFGV